MSGKTRKNTLNKNHKGFVLITTLILSIVFFIMCATFASIVRQDVAKTRDIKNSAITYYVAEGGIQYVKGQICQGRITDRYIQGINLYRDGLLSGSFNVMIENYTNPTIGNYNLQGDANNYRYLYVVQSTANLTTASRLLAQKSIKAEIATTGRILSPSFTPTGQSVAGYIYRTYEKYR